MFLKTYTTVYLENIHRIHLWYIKDTHVHVYCYFVDFSYLKYTEWFICNIVIIIIYY